MCIRDRVNSSNNINVRICAMTLKTATKVDATTWEYTVSASFGNAGAAILGGTAKLVVFPALLQVVDAELQYGALAQGETGRSLDTVTLRSKLSLQQSFFDAGVGFKWNITTR